MRSTSGSSVKVVRTKTSGCRAWKSTWGARDEPDAALVAIERDATLGDGAHHRRQQLVLLRQDAQPQALLVVVVEYEDGGLRQDGAAVNARIHEMDGATGDLDPVAKGLCLAVDARKCWQERGVD